MCIMKKSLFYLMALFCALNLFSSCGDDDNKDEPTPEDTTWKAVAGSYTADKLKLTYNGQELSNQSVTVEAVSAEKATAILKGMVAGVDEVKVDLIMSKATKAEEVIANYNLEGTATVEGSRTVSVTGNVNAGVLTLAVAIKVDSPLVGTWIFPSYVPSDVNGDGKIDANDYNVMGGSFFMNLATESGEIAFGGQTIPDYQFCAFVDQKAEAAIAEVAPEITFVENGNITISFTKDGKATKLEGLMGYYVKDKMLYVTLDITALMGMLKSENNTLAELIAMAQNGIPLVLEEEDGEYSILINNTLATSLGTQLAPVMELIAGFMPDKAEMIGQIGALLPVIMADKDFMVGINLSKK